MTDHSKRVAAPGTDAVRVYISGPMTGLPEHNYPAFEAAASKLRQLGYEPVSPTKIGQHEGWQWSDYMRQAVKLLAEADAIILLGDWQTSKGARIERRLAEDLDLLSLGTIDMVPSLKYARHMLRSRGGRAGR